MTQGIFGIGIETSCDETSVSVVRDGREIISNIVYSQIPEHAPFRGVVPEIASRSHLEKINEVYLSAMTQAGVRPEDLSYVAVTNRPGLTGSLMMGGVLAKSLGLLYGIPMICVDHLEAHIAVVNLQNERPEGPALGLLLSGGNSAIFLYAPPEEMKVIGNTTDDALGEAFDKAASVLDLPYPGGPHIERMAESCDPSLKKAPPVFSRLLKNRPSEEILFSFSGIKTAVIRAHREGVPVEKICYDFQNTVFELVQRNIKKAVKQTSLRTVVASGGVLANGELRRQLKELSDIEKIDIRTPEQKILCTDNGAMVAARGYELFQERRFCSLDFEVFSRR